MQHVGYYSHHALMKRHYPLFTGRYIAVRVRGASAPNHFTVAFRCCSSSMPSEKQFDHTGFNADFRANVAVLKSN